MVILDEFSGQSQCFELVRPENLGKKTAIILENLGSQNDHISQVS